MLDRDADVAHRHTTTCTVIYTCFVMCVHILCLLVSPDARCEYIQPMDCKKLRQGQEPLLKVALIQLADEASILSVTLAHCIAGKTLSAHGKGCQEFVHWVQKCCMYMPMWPLPDYSAGTSTGLLFHDKANTHLCTESMSAW